MIPELQKLMRRYLEEGKGRTPQSLAAKAGVGASTVRRILQGEVKTAELTNVLGILKVVARWDESLAFLQQYFPDTGNYFSKIATASNVTDWTKNISEELERALLDFESFVIISLASTPLGATDDDMISTIGRHAEYKIDSLMDSGVLEKRGDRYFTVNKTFASYDNQVLIAELSHCTRFIRAENVGRKRQHCAVRTDGVSVEGQQKIHECLQKALVEIEGIIAENEGDQPIFYAALMGMFKPEGRKNA